VAGNHESEFGIVKDVRSEVLKNPIASVLRPINPSSTSTKYSHSVPFQ
jgi:hypothetical protein